MQEIGRTIGGGENMIDQLLKNVYILCIPLLLLGNFVMMSRTVDEMKITNEYMAEINKSVETLDNIKLHAGSISASTSAIRIDTHLIKCGL